MLFLERRFRRSDMSTNAPYQYIVVSQKWKNFNQPSRATSRPLQLDGSLFVAISRDKSHDEKESGPSADGFAKCGGVDLLRCPAKSGCHWYSERIAKTEATAPLFS